LELKSVNKDNQNEIIADGPHHKTPLGPHVCIDDNMLSTNIMAQDLINAAMNKRYFLEESEPFISKRKKPLGLVTCRTIKEAKFVREYILSKGETCEVIASDDENSAQRLREISKGKRQPNWIVSVGMVSEGVDIKEIKVIAFLNAITTILFLIQLIGRALRRMTYDVNGVSTYLDEGLTNTKAFLFAPAHPAIVKVGLELESIGNQAIKDKNLSLDESGKSEEKSNFKKYDVVGGEATTFYRGVEMNIATAKILEAIVSHQKTMDELGPIWVDMIHQWIETGKESQAVTEIEKRISEAGIVPNPEKNFNSALDYDTETKLLRQQANNLVQQIRFSVPRFKSMADSDAYKEIRVYLCCKTFGENKFKPIDKMSLDQKRRFVNTAKQVYRQEA